jgi:hypothetical protein
LIFHLDTDLKGLPYPYRPLAEEGKRLKTYKLATYLEYEEVADALAETVKAGDLVIVDTLSQLVEATLEYLKERAMLAAGISRASDAGALFEKVSAFGRDYKESKGLIMQKLKNLSARGARLILNVHQKSAYMDADRSTIVSTFRGIPMDSVKMIGPSLNNQLFEQVNARATDIYRLSRFNEDVKDDDGNVCVPYGTRLLHLTENPGDVIKSSAPPDRLAALREGLLSPTLPKLYTLIGGKPEMMVIYSPPGVGKTTFALSSLALEKKAAE